VNVEGQTLTITGRRDFEKEEKTEEYSAGAAGGKFVRSIQLPTSIDKAKVEATYHDGVMTVRWPRPSRPARLGSRSRMRRATWMVALQLTPG
jgi:HSP20 family molecular chaperone IbpA